MRLPEKISSHIIQQSGRRE